MVAPSRTQKKQSDFTGRQAAQEAAKAAEAKKALDEQVAMQTAAEQREFAENVYDLTADPQSPTVIDEVVEVGVELADDTVIVRVSEDIENMTFGYRNNYTFKAGGKYKVPRRLAERLETLGLVWH